MNFAKGNKHIAIEDGIAKKDRVYDMEDSDLRGIGSACRVISRLVVRILRANETAAPVSVKEH